MMTCRKRRRCPDDVRIYIHVSIHGLDSVDYTRQGGVTYDTDLIVDNLTEEPTYDTDLIADNWTGEVTCDTDSIADNWTGGVTYDFDLIVYIPQEQCYPQETQP
ncbi:hypothetical protein BgiMline_004500 [Biomphalaria glabrata]